MKAMIAMSGGVDSSVAAYLAIESGLDCIGVTMKLFNNEDAGISRELDAKSEVNYQQKLLDERKKKLDDFVAARKKENGGRFSIEAMTEQQRAEFGNLRADYRESRGNVRSAKGAYMDVLWEGNQRAVDFRNGLKESNRLTSMGLAGGGTMKWGVDTASNTKEMVRLQRELNKRLAEERNGLATGSATYGY